jgi:hypothetical protein
MLMILKTPLMRLCPLRLCVKPPLKYLFEYLETLPNLCRPFTLIPVGEVAKPRIGSSLM